VQIKVAILDQHLSKYYVVDCAMWECMEAKVTNLTTSIIEIKKVTLDE
jgi:hypothetical protein